MDLTQAIDGYCERMDASLWAEPINAVSNIAFLIAAFVMWRRCRETGLNGALTRGKTLVIGRLLAVIIGAIGIGSGLFHTVANGWSALADVIPIGGFILIYLYAVNADVLKMPWWLAALGMGLFIPYAAILTPVIEALPFFRISNFYWSVPILILAYAPFVAGRSRDMAIGMVWGALLLMASISIRSLDEMLCEVIPMGTHFMWHILNAVMLAWMIEIYRRHRLSQAG